MNRRQFVKSSSLLGVAATISFNSVFGGDRNSNPYNFITTSQSPLAYGLTGLQPVIEESIMNLHYNKHAAGYLKKLNDYLLENKITDKSPYELIQGDLSNATLKNNLGGHFNHELFWRCMRPVGGAAMPEALKTQLVKDFGSIDDFKSKFADAANKIFGSGWAWLCLDESKSSLFITTSANQNNPLSQNEARKGYPILGLDVWEHAYYLQYQNRRSDYTKAFWDIANWDFINTLFLSLK